MKRKMDLLLVSRLGFTPRSAGDFLYVKADEKFITILKSYVDGLLISCNDILLMESLKSKLSPKFEIKDIDEARVCLGCET